MLTRGPKAGQQNAHAAAVSVSKTVSHWAGRSCRFNKDIAFYLLAVSQKDPIHDNRLLPALFHVNSSAHEANLHAHVFEQASHLRFHLHHIIKAGVSVSREIHIRMSRAAVRDVKQFARSQSDIFFRRCKSAVIAHNAAYVAETQQKVGFLKKSHFRSGFSRGYRGGAAGPASSDDYYFIQKNYPQSV